MATQPLDPAAKSRILNELAFMVQSNALRYVSDEGKKDSDRPSSPPAKTALTNDKE